MQSRKWRDAIDHVATIAKKETCSLQSLEQGLVHLAETFEQDKISALAFIAGTAAESCQAGCVDAVAARLAVIELCSRILVAMETSQPFDFTDADIGLTALLFPQLNDTHSQDADSPYQVRAESTFAEGAIDAITNESMVEICLCSDEQLLNEFLNEANEHIQNAEQLILDLENNPLDHESINGLFRAVHSIKGSAGVVELKSLGAITHLAESVLVRLRDGKITLRGNVFEVILAAVDSIAEQVRSLTECHLAKRLLQVPIPPRILLTCLETITTTGECSSENLHLLKNIPTKVVTESSKKETKSAQSDTLRVDGKRLEQLIDLIGELVITDAMVQRELYRRENLTASSVSLRLKKVVREIQQLSLTLKMVPIGNVFQKLNRLVRDLSVKLNKQVEVQIIGAETEVDKTLLECIADPLVHLIRNSIDHGIEPTTAERIATGKPAVASIRLKAEHRAGSVHLQISDDGRGLNRERIVARAIERGLIDSAAKLTEQEIDNLIFEPGFSTATEVTDISGRGVGMDVVRRNVESMRGSISLTSHPGLGTEISLELPLTLSIIDGTVVRIGERSFIVPTLSVVEQVQFASLEFSGNGECQLVRFRSRFVSVKKLGDILGSPHASWLKHGQVVMIVESGGKQYALIVDEVLGQQPVVIKPLGGVMSGISYFAGGALLSDGQIGFVLDLNAVCSINN